jgi:hypothetical protein
MYGLPDLDKGQRRLVLKTPSPRATHRWFPQLAGCVSRMGQHSAPFNLKNGASSDDI